MSSVEKVLMLVGLLFICGILIFSEKDAPTDERVVTEIVNEYNVYALPMPENLTFAGEKVPISDANIRERMDRELHVNTYWQSNGFLLFKRANKYFPIIEPILKEHGIPEDFKYLAVIESGLTQALSPARAAGFWQILRTTGREYGLEVNTNVDERYHIEKSTKVACRYLKKAKERLGSWSLAAAAYNAGPSGIARRLREQKATSYYDLLLGEETGRYVFRIIAVKEILSNPKLYGFNFRDKDLYDPIPTFKVKVDEPIADFADFAKDHGISYKTLKLHNGWLRERHLNNSSKKEYRIEIPQKGFYQMAGQ